MTFESEEDILLPGSIPKGAIFAIGIFIMLAGGLFVRIAYADDLPQDILDWINSNGTKGSPVHVISGDNITFNGTSNNSLVSPGNSSGQAGSNPAGATNIGNTMHYNVVQNVSQSNTSDYNSTNQGGGGLVGNITLLNETPVSFSEPQSILNKQPILSIYAGENYTVYVQDNKQSSAWFRWLIGSMVKR